MKFSLRTDWPHLLLIAAIWLTAAIAWPLAPEKIPVHWNVHGEVDRYGGKLEGIAVLPVLALAVYLLMLFLPKIDPGRANYERFRTPYAVIRFALLAVLATVYALALLATFGARVNMELAIMLVLGVLLLVLGNFMGKIRPNWFIGIRTPWTLSSKLSWTKTHRLGGWVFIGLGLLTMAAAFLPGVWSVAVFFGATMVGVLGLTLYSYLVWRRDPDRIPPAGTQPSNE
jgi:uncharacterized membrane protein